MQEFVNNNICKIPYKYNHKPHSTKTIIFLVGTGGNHEEWDDMDVTKFWKTVRRSWPEGAKYDKLMHKGKIELQKELSGRYTTFSFTPFEYLLLNNEENGKDYAPLEPNKYFFDMGQMIYTMKRLIAIHSLPPPYVFVGFSEGGWRALLFEQTIPHVRGCVLIDPQRFVASSPENRLSCSVRASASNLSDKLAYFKCVNLIRKFRLRHKSQAKICLHMNLMNFGNDYTERFLSEIEYIEELQRNYPNLELTAYFDKIHSLHFMYRKDILQSIMDA